MDRYGSTIPTKGYSGDISGRKRVQLNADPVKGSYDTTGHYHSTPKPKAFSTSISGTSPSFKARAGNTSYPIGMTSTRTPRSKSPFRNTSPLGRRSLSPVSQRNTSPPQHLGSSFSPNKQLSDVDSDTIQRQRRELQLLIGELKDRDRELNDMVQAHQKQIVAWEEDRQRVFALEKRCSRFESEIKSKAEQMRALQARIKATEVEEQNKTKELEDAQVQLQHVSEQANTSIHQVQELEEKNSNLTSTMRELSNTIGQLQAREQELSTRLSLKDNDITAASVRLGELQQRIQRMDSACQELKKAEVSMRNERDQWRDQALANKQEVEKLRGDISKQFTDADEIQAELAKTRQEVLVLQKELFLAGEREKRKDQLLELQKSKQERTDSELQNLRQICERQQRDISYMQLQLQSSHDTLPKTDLYTTDTRSSEVGGSHKEEKGNYLNTDFDNQDGVSTKLVDLDGPLVSNDDDDDDDDDDLTPYLFNTRTRMESHNGAISSISLHATAGSDVTDDLESFTQEPLQPQPVTDKSYSGTNSEVYPSSQPYYSAPATRVDVFASLGNLSLSAGKAEDPTGYVPFSRPGDLSSVGVVPRIGDTYPSYSMSAPPSMPSAQAEENSPTTKLHRLLAESRQMVQNLEQTSSFSAPGSTSPKQDRVGDSTSVTSDQYTPPQRHLGSPLRGLPNSSA